MKTKQFITKWPVDNWTNHKRKKINLEEKDNKNDMKRWMLAKSNVVIVVQLLSHVWLFVTSWTAAYLASLSFTIAQSLLKFMSIESVMVSKHLILCHSLLLPPDFFQHQDLFQWVSSLQWVTKVLELQFLHQSFLWIFRVDFFRNDWFDLLALQGTLKTLIQHHSSKALILHL